MWWFFLGRLFEIHILYLRFNVDIINHKTVLCSYTNNNNLAIILNQNCLGLPKCVRCSLADWQSGSLAKAVCRRRKHVVGFRVSSCYSLCWLPVWLALYIAFLLPANSKQASLALSFPNSHIPETALSV